MGDVLVEMKALVVCIGCDVTFAGDDREYPRSGRRVIRFEVDVNINGHLATQTFDLSYQCRILRNKLYVSGPG